MKYPIVRLIDRPDLKEQMARWFHEKWGIPLEAYLESMEDCLSGKAAVPQWYVAMDGSRIIGGMGVIENDFHDRKDLTPNVCAVYTEPDMRGKRIAACLLDFVCRDMQTRGIDCLYLLTDHTGLYERYGWTFLCMVQGDGEEEMSRMYFRKVEDQLTPVYEKLKDRFDLTMTTTYALDEGFTINCPILVGKAHGQIIELYEDGRDFVLDVMDEAQTMGTHWHPNDVDSAVKYIEEFMEGKDDYKLTPFPKQ